MDFIVKQKKRQTSINKVYSLIGITLWYMDMKSIMVFFI